MSNMFNLFEDYEQRYHNWLRQSVNPKLQPIMKNLQKNLEPTRDYLWGTAPTDS